jgi:hypothetical protein
MPHPWGVVAWPKVNLTCRNRYLKRCLHSFWSLHKI